MELILGLIVFGVLGAICIYGLISSMRAVRETERGQLQERPMAGVSNDPASPSG